MHTRVEFSEGTSHKFWEVEVNGCEITTRWGRIGTAGQAKTKAHASEAAALQDARAQLASKVKGGYREVSLSSSTVQAPVPSSTAAAPASQEEPAQAAVASAPAPLTEAARPAVAAALAILQDSRPTNNAMEAVRSHAFAWRDWGRDIPPLPPRSKSVARLDTWELGLGVTVPSLRRAQRDALQLLQNGARTQEPLATAAALRIAPEHTDRVIAANGFIGTAEGLLQLRELRPAAEGEHPPRFRWLVYTQHVEIDTAVLNFAPWARLRHALALASDAEYAEFVEWARAKRVGADVETRVMLAFLLPDQDWAGVEIEACAQQTYNLWGTDYVPTYALALVPSLRELSLVKRVWDMPFFDPIPPVLACSLIANLGEAAYPLILKHLTGPHKAEWAEQLWSIPEPQLASQLRVLLEDRSLRGKLSEYYLEHPQISIPVLANVVAYNGKGKEIARTLLTQMLRSQVSLPPLDSREQAVCQQIQTRLTRQVEEAPADELPPVLFSPPWIGKPQPRQAVVAEARNVVLEECIHWGASRPKPFYRSPPPPESMPDAAVYERLLQESARFPLSLSRLDELGDERALHLWNTTSNWREPSWDRLGPLLARFGTAAISGVVRLAGKHPGACMEDLHCVESPRLAPVGRRSHYGQAPETGASVDATLSAGRLAGVDSGCHGSYRKSSRGCGRRPAMDCELVAPAPDRAGWRRAWSAGRVGGSAELRPAPAGAEQTA